MGGRNGQRSIGGVSVHVNIYSLSSQYRGRRRRREAVVRSRRKTKKQQTEEGGKCKKRELIEQKTMK